MAITAIATGITAAASAYSSRQQRKAAEGAQDFAQKQALKTEKAAELANNKANQKKPNGATLLSSNRMAAQGGVGGTMLTGPSGIDPSALSLGRTTLLGGGG
jgi:hypothetical protein